MASKIQYQIVGRYMDGKEVTGYHLQSMESGKAGRYTREQVAYFVGRGQVTNCSGQLYQDKLLLRGVGMSLDDLPVQQEDGSLSRTKNIGHVRKGTSAADAMTQCLLAKAIVNGRNTIGYVIQNSAGQTMNVTRANALELIKAGKIGNARYQESNGKPIVRGVGVNLNELPQITAEQAGISLPKNQTQNATAGPASSGATSTSQNATAGPASSGATSTKEDKAKKAIERFYNLCYKYSDKINEKVPGMISDISESDIYEPSGNGTIIDELTEGVQLLGGFNYSVTTFPLPNNCNFGGKLELMVNKQGSVVTFNVDNHIYLNPTKPDDDPSFLSYEFTELEIKNIFLDLAKKFEKAYKKYPEYAPESFRDKLNKNAGNTEKLLKERKFESKRTERVLDSESKIINTFKDAVLSGMDAINAKVPHCFQDIRLRSPEDFLITDNGELCVIDFSSTSVNLTDGKIFGGTFSLLKRDNKYEIELMYWDDPTREIDPDYIDWGTTSATGSNIRSKLEEYASKVKRVYRIHPEFNV